jgi:hypothetical protein
LRFPVKQPSPDAKLTNASGLAARSKVMRQRLSAPPLVKSSALSASEVELQRKLNQPRVIARRDNEAEVAGVSNLSGVLINDGRVEVADGVVEVDVISTSILG